MLLILNVYLPYCKEDNQEEFLFYLSKIDHLIKQSGTPFVIVAGDYNANILPDPNNQITHKFGKELLKFCHDEDLVLLDMLHLKGDSFTFVSESHGTFSWIDHMVRTVNICSAIKNMYIEYGGI